MSYCSFGSRVSLCLGCFIAVAYGVMSALAVCRIVVPGFAACIRVLRCGAMIEFESVYHTFRLGRLLCLDSRVRAGGPFITLRTAWPNGRRCWLHDPGGETMNLRWHSMHPSHWRPSWRAHIIPSSLHESCGCSFDCFATHPVPVAC